MQPLSLFPLCATDAQPRLRQDCSGCPRARRGSFLFPSPVGNPTPGTKEGFRTTLQVTHEFGFGDLPQDARPSTTSVLSLLLLPSDGD